MLKRFLNKLHIQTNGCWLWTGALDYKGYGRFFVSGKNVLAHRVAYTLYVGDIPEDMMVCHSCDVPSCVNPAHLFLGTNQDNMNDMKSKNRGNKLQGEKHGRSKLTTKEVLNMRELYKAGNWTHRSLAAKYNVARATVRDILSGKHWRTV